MNIALRSLVYISFLLMSTQLWSVNDTKILSTEFPPVLSEFEFFIDQTQQLPEIMFTHMNSSRLYLVIIPTKVDLFMYPMERRVFIKKTGSLIFQWDQP